MFNNKVTLFHLTYILYCERLLQLSSNPDPNYLKKSDSFILSNFIRQILYLKPDSYILSDFIGQFYRLYRTVLHYDSFILSDFK